MLYSGTLSHSTLVPPGSPPMLAKAPSLLPIGAQTLTLWHQRLGHLNYHDLCRLLDISKGIPVPDSQKLVDPGVCSSCIWENTTRYIGNIGNEHCLPMQTRHWP